MHAHAAGDLYHPMTQGKIELYHRLMTYRILLDDWAELGLKLTGVRHS